MIVVADAGPIIHLSMIGRLDLIRPLAGEVLIPDAVYDEVVVAGAGRAGAAEVRQAPWITVATPTRNDLVSALVAGGLHRGESEAIALAVERAADLLLIDERQGRATAEAMGLRVLGSLGVLVAAKQRREIAAVAPLLDAMRDSGLWLADDLVERVLDALGERTR